MIAKIRSLALVLLLGGCAVDPAPGDDCRIDCWDDEATWDEQAWEEGDHAHDLDEEIVPAPADDLAFDRSAARSDDEENPDPQPWLFGAENPDPQPWRDDEGDDESDQGNPDPQPWKAEAVNPDPQPWKDPFASAATSHDDGDQEPDPQPW